MYVWASLCRKNLWHKIFLGDFLLVAKSKLFGVRMQNGKLSFSVVIFSTGAAL